MAAASGIKGVRLILADASIGGGQRVKTFSDTPLSIDAVIGLLSEDLGLKDICSEKGLDPVAISVDSLSVMGFDGARRIPIRNDAGLVEYLGSTQQSAIPTLEVQLARAAQSPTGAATSAREPPKDHVDQLEDANFKLVRANEKLARRIDEVERAMQNAQEENRRNIEVAVRDLTASQASMEKAFEEKVAQLQEKDASILSDLDVVRQHSNTVEQQDNDHHEEMQKGLKELTERMEEMFQAVDEQIAELRNTDEALKVEDERQQGLLDAHGEELARLDKVKVEEAAWRESEDEMSKRIDEESTNIHRSLAQAEADLNDKISKACTVQKQDHETLFHLVEEHRERGAAEDMRIEGLFDAGLAKAAQDLERVRQEVLADAAKKVLDLSETTEARFTETKSVITKKDGDTNLKVDDLTNMCQTTFKAVDERIEEMVRVFRARFGTVEKDVVEKTSTIRADCRGEIERVRADYELQAARLDTDLGDLHMKHDVTKQEIAFVQEKLLEQREWAHRQLTETATATRAVQVDSQEGLAATTKMLHALRDDAVGFREKMAKYVSLLQHSSDSQGDAISSLEAQRGGMRSDLDMLIADHKAYTGDMDSWADDVRIKVERLFRAMEPAKVDWRIHRAFQRSKDLKKPLAVKSPTFSLRGLREVQMEFYPDGTNTSPDDKAVLRVFLPPGTHLRFQCWLGFATEGPMETTVGGSLTLDMLVDDWKSQILEDGSLPVKMEVLRDLGNPDESLTTEVRVESP